MVWNDYDYKLTVFTSEGKAAGVFTMRRPDWEPVCEATKGRHNQHPEEPNAAVTSLACRAASVLKNLRQISRKLTPQLDVSRRLRRLRWNLDTSR